MRESPYLAEIRRLDPVRDHVPIVHLEACLRVPVRHHACASWRSSAPLPCRASPAARVDAIAAGIEPLRRIYDRRHTFATFALRAGISTFDLSRYMGASLTMIDRHYGHSPATDTSTPSAARRAQRRRTSTVDARGRCVTPKPAAAASQDNGSSG
jgi:integrase